MLLKLDRWIISGTTLLFVSFASAQSTPSGEAPTSGDLGPSAELSAQRDVALTPQQMLKNANDHVMRMDQGSRSVRAQLSQARQERDVVKVLCLNDKLNQLNVALASASERKAALESMVADNNTDRAKHEYTIITVLRERAETLLTEANQCVGEELGYLGETEVVVDIDPEIPDTDPSDFPRDPFGSGIPPTIISRPRQPASPG